MKPTHILIHYAEIGLKGRNRPFFEKKLVENIKKSLGMKGVNFDKVQKKFGRILVTLSKKSNLDKAREVLQDTFGIANFSYTLKVSSNIEDIKKQAVEIFKNENFDTFKINTKRSDKSFSTNSMEVNKEVGAEIADNLNKKVDLTNPQKTLFIEITEDGTFIYLEKHEGPGGLPVGSSSKTVTLLSGGIDSPVAGYLMNKRGVENIFIHFHSYPYTSRDSIEKAEKIVEILNKYQFNSKLYLVPFAEIQKEILDKVPESLRIIIYRRFMLRIAERIAEKEKASTLTTGESIGQVGSQTLENIRAVSETVELPILRPLISFDKREIINLSKKIKAYETSILPCEDACTWFMPQNPETRATVAQVKEAEKNLNIENLIEKGLEATELRKVPKKESR